MPLSANELAWLSGGAAAGAAIAGAWLRRRIPRGVPGQRGAVEAQFGRRIGQDHVLELIASGAPLTDSLRAIVALIEAELPGSGSIMRAGDGVLRVAAHSDRMPPGLLPTLQSLPIAEGAGVCGTAAARRAEVVAADLATDPLAQDFRSITQALGLRSCWSAPVIAADGTLLATFALYFTETRIPTADDRAVLEVAGRLSRIAFERERAAEAQARSQALLKQLGENLQEVFYVRDARSGEMIYVSAGYERLWGRSASSLYAQPVSYLDAIHPDDRPAALAARARQDEGQATTVEYRITAADGALHWIEDRTYPVRGAGGTIERFVGIALDLTRQKQDDLRLAAMNRALEMLSQCNEALALREDEPALLRQICEIAVHGGGYRMAWVGYIAQDDHGVVMPVAHAGAELGYLSEIRLSAQGDDPTGRGPVAQALRTGATVAVADIAREEGFYWREAALRRGYRSIVCLPLHVRGRVLGMLALYGTRTDPLDDDELRLLHELAGNLALGIGGIRERTERQRVQDEVHRLNANLERRVQERTAQLGTAYRELEGFSYSLAHDLRAPLAAIDGFSQALSESLGDRLEPRQKHYVQRVRAGAQRMSEMIDALLSLANVSRTPLRLGRVDLAAIARAELDALAEHSPGRHVRTMVHEPIVVQGDERLLQLVLQNLLGNAWKFTSAREDALIEVGVRTGHDGGLVYFVRDNGIGFDMAHADKLFGPFQRLHADSEYPGTGLGLASCQRVIERHGGRIRASARPGEGACFEFTIGDHSSDLTEIIGAG